MRRNTLQNLAIITTILFSLFFAKEETLAQTPGATYCGSFKPSSQIILNGVNDSIISGLEISGQSGHCIKLYNCKNITIQQCKLSASTGNGVTIENCNNILITDCRIDSVATGVYALTSTNVQVINNSVKNLLGPMPRGQMVQFDKVSGEKNKISYNVAENVFGESYPEDIINLYKSRGTTDNPIEIFGNWIRGGGPSISGGGIMTGDKGSANIVIKDNILVDPGQYGIAIAGGNNIHIIDNTIYAKQQSFTNVGLYVRNYNSPSICDNHQVSGNKVNWTHRSGSKNPCWNGNDCGPIAGWDNNSWDANIGSDILPEKIFFDATCDEANTSPEESHTTKCNINLEASIIDEINFDSNGSIDIQPSGGNGAYMYNWSDGHTTEDRTNLSQGTYAVTVTDENGCEATGVWRIGREIRTDGEQSLDNNHNPGTTFCGPYTPSSKIILNGVSDSIISGLNIINPNGHCIELVNCRNITIQQCKLSSLTGHGIYIEDCDNIIVSDCRLDSVAFGVYALLSSNIQVMNNNVKNLLGPKGQMVTLDKVSGERNSINHNIVENIFGESNPEVIIELYKSSGTSESPIEVFGNWIRGGGPSSSGGGIMTRGNGTANIIIKDNILVNPGQYGIAIAGGNNVQLIDNSIYSKQQSFTNVGLYVWNQDTSVSCANHIIAGNRVNWTNNNGKKNPSWNANNCGTIAGWDNNIWNANISSDILPENILPDSLCDEKANCTDCPQVPSCNITIEAEIVDATDDHTNGSIDIKISGGINPYIYDWSDGYTTKDRTNLQQGTYTLTVTDSNGCIASNSWSIEDNSSNKDGDLVSTPMANNEKQLFNIYPNPATQFFTIELIENGIVRIFDISGRKVFQKYMHRGKHSFTTEFPKGCYVVSVHLDNSLINKQKLIIK